MSGSLVGDFGTTKDHRTRVVVVMDWTGPDPVGILYLWEGGDTLTTLAQGITAVAW